MNVLDFQKMKLKQKRIVVSTCYDYTSAKILANTSIDCLLVGDSVGMTMHGFVNTIAVTLAMMQLATAAVARGAINKFIIADLPFLSYRKSLSQSVTVAEVLMQSGSQALKLEGAAGNLKLISHLVNSGIPIMGHLGLTPQYVNILGGYRVQGQTELAAKKIKQDAKALEEAGCFALVLECIPQKLAKEITEELSIATIGIGAGPNTDGQVLVFQDYLGLNSDFKPKFVKKFLEGSELVKIATESYINQVKRGEFPADEHSY